MSERPQPTALLLVVGALALALVGLSWLLAGLDLGAWGTPVALGIAAIKALLIAWYFMELREARTSLRVAALAALLLFVLLVGLSTVDVATREPPPPAPGEPRGFP
ncbi:cytochrome C oxidase subunit IV family protein [Vulgatibacter sp.]|uniref:cytochrome C oxidase subunit IV family protein n=1 Tax=Vulgatibacter sp. TaxID=1971226 RepID=UPI00356A58A8